MSSPWMISIRSGDKQEELLFPVKENETHKQNFTRVKRYYKALKKKYPHYTIEVISRKKAIPPKKKTKRGYRYCPYCMRDRKFVYNKYKGYSFCPVCNISDADFYVKKYKGGKK
jgi:hypothetical protein